MNRMMWQAGDLDADNDDAEPGDAAREADPPAWLPDAHFGPVDKADPDSKPDVQDDPDDDPDDELLDETPPDVVLMLGFDPADADGDDDAPPAEPPGAN